MFVASAPSFLSKAEICLWSRQNIASSIGAQWHYGQCIHDPIGYTWTHRGTHRNRERARKRDLIAAQLNWHRECSSLPLEIIENSKVHKNHQAKIIIYLFGIFGVIFLQCLRRSRVHFIYNLTSLLLRRWRMTGSMSPWSLTGFSSGFLWQCVFWEHWDSSSSHSSTSKNVLKNVLTPFLFLLSFFLPPHSLLKL